MDFGMITLWVLAVVGVVAIIMGIIIAISIWHDDGATPYEMRFPYEEERNKQAKEEAFQYLDNEVRGSIRRNLGRRLPNGYPTSEPTLKARVDMIEQHLGITVYVEAAKPEKVVIKKGKKA